MENYENITNPKTTMEVSPEELLACDFINSVDTSLFELCNSETVNFHNIRLTFKVDKDTQVAEVYIQYNAIENDAETESTVVLGRSENIDLYWSAYRKVIEILDFKEVLKRLAVHFSDLGCMLDTLKIA